MLRRLSLHRPCHELSSSPPFWRAGSASHSPSPSPSVGLHLLFVHAAGIQKGIHVTATRFHVTRCGGACCCVVARRTSQAVQSSVASGSSYVKAISIVSIMASTRGICDIGYHNAPTCKMKLITHWHHSEFEQQITISHHPPTHNITSYTQRVTPFDIRVT